MIQSTLGISSPRAATSVHSRMPVVALPNSKKVFVRFCCFCLPCRALDSRKHQVQAYERTDNQTHMQVHDWYVNIVEQFGVVFDGVATGEEDDDLLLEVFA